MNDSEHLQRLFRQYEAENNHEPTGTKSVVKWAVDKGLLDLPEIDPIDVLAGKMARALRTEQAVDADGRKHRVNHAVKVMKNGVQETFWGIMGFAPKEHMEMAFRQRREQVIGDCYQLKTDVDAYNAQNPHQPQIQLELDFTDDVAEREALLETDKAA
jgi:hypothetical protein